MNRILHAAFCLCLILAAASGCHKAQKVENKDYSHMLGPGESALRLITDPARMPDIGAAYRSRPAADLNEAIRQSQSWFAAPSSKQFFPFENIATHEQAAASVYAFQRLLDSASDEASFVESVKANFNVYESVGYNNEGIVLFTGYYSPIFNASKTRTDRFRYPLYKRPADLATDPKTGAPLGRKLPDGGVVPYYTRREIETSNMFRGNELVWVEDALSAYVIQVNGSAKLRMPDNSFMYIGYNGKTDRPYTGLGKMMLDEGVLKPDELGLPAIRRKFEQDPAKVTEMMYRNESYVFFTEYPSGKWPSGSLGVRVTEKTSLATDKKIFPRGGVVMVDTQAAVELSQGQKRFQSFMLDQDTGGAIKAPGRADIYLGVGSRAELLAGAQYAEGRLYYFILKPDNVAEFSPMAKPAAKGK